MNTQHQPTPDPSNNTADKNSEHPKTSLSPPGCLLPTVHCQLTTDNFDWAWPGWLPNGYLTILASPPGVGKSFLALRIAASFIDNRPWPDGAPAAIRARKPLWCESESGRAMHWDRLRAMHLDPNDLTFAIDGIWGNFELANKEHREALWNAARSAEITLLVLDSLSGLHGHGRRARATLEFVPELAELAGEFGMPVLATYHLHRRPNLDRGQPDLERLLDSPILASVARAIWILDAPDPTDPDNRRLSMVKNNLAPLAGPIGVRIDARGPHFGPPPQARPEELEGPPALPAAQSQEDRAVSLLKELLANGPCPPPGSTTLPRPPASPFQPSSAPKATSASYPTNNPTNGPGNSPPTRP